MKLFRIPNSTLALWLIALLVSFASAVQAQEAFKVTTVYLVRHAEKGATPANNPPLTDAGKARAEALVAKLSQAQIKVVISSQFLRTKQTAEPVAKKAGIEITEIPVAMSSMNSKEIAPEYFKQVIEKIHAANGGSVLLVGHSNTIPEIIKALGGDIVPVIDDSEYNDLFAVTIYAKGKAKVAHLRQ